VKKSNPRNSQNSTNARRRFVVFVSLVGMLTLTSALLLALSPAPLAPDAARTLSAVDGPDSLQEIFTATQVLPQDGRWKYIYIHHSRTPAGDAASLGQATGGLPDHFLIGNGHGCDNGEIQLSQRWSLQSPAVPPPGITFFPSCISICLVGDLDRSLPTSVQMHRLGQLVTTLQNRFHIKSSDILLVEQAGTPGGIGKYFPLTAFREQLAQ